MFGGGTSTEYEDIVNKTTDENLTSENWELILNLCDKVQEEGQPGAHAAIAAILKRLAHRNPNVQLYALSLTESLGKNLGIEIHREIASRAFTQGLEKLIADRNTHEKVRRRALALIALWTAEFEKDETLGIMEDCYNNLKAKNYKFEQPSEPPPPTVDDEIRRKEEEELQRVLEMSMQDKGGRSQWSEYSLASGSSSGAGASSSSAGKGSTAAASASTSAAGGSSSAHPFAQPKYSGGGYVPARTPSPATVAAKQRQQEREYQQSILAQQAQQSQAQPQPQLHHAASSVSTITSPIAMTPTTGPAAATAVSPAPAANMNIVTRVRALHTFEPTEPGELAFDKGDVIKVVDRGYKDWWRGQLKGRTGIFPVNYVEAMPEPTSTELAKEAEQEATVFAQAVNVEKLLNMLRSLDPVKDNLADNEEIQELYRSSMALRPKIVKLIDKYSQKRADLVSMNETFVRARTIFDRMMEESLARHTGVYDQPTFRPPFQQVHPQAARPGSRNTGRPEYGPGPLGPQPYGWGPQQQQQPPQVGYPGYPGGGPTPGGYPMSTPTPTPGQGQGPEGYAATPGPGQQPPYGGMPPQGPPQQQQPQQAVPGGYGVVPQGGYAGHQPNTPYTQQGPTPYPVQQQQGQPPFQQQQQPPHQQQPQQPQQPFQQPGQQPQLVQQQQQQQQPSQEQLLQHRQSYMPPAQQAQVQPQPAQQLPVQPLQQSQPQTAQHEPAAQAQSQPAAAISAQMTPQEAQPQPQVQPQPQAQPQPSTQLQPQQPISGPGPYPYHPSYKYEDQNVQAWADYYAQGGKELTGAVYFLSIPGVKEDSAVPTPQPQVQPQEQQQGGVSRQQSYVPQAQQQQQQQPQQQPEHTEPVRQQSYEAQPQPQGQLPSQMQALVQQVESELPYGPGAPAGGSPVHQQQLHTMPRYQLSDGPAPQGQQLQAQPQGGPQPQFAYSGPSPDGAGPHSPTAASFAAGASTAPLNVHHGQRPGTGGSAGRAHSPQATSGTPSWVLPKKNTPAPGGSPPTAGSSYFPLSNQMAG